jgi:radical SAM superfamily enzyme YgiQ (UPF0313 family)
MKLLLVSPAPFPPSRAAKALQQMRRMGIHGGDSPPLGLASIAAPAEAAGHEVRLLDMRTENTTREEMEAELRAFAPDAIGWYLATFNIRECVEAARFARSVRPGAQQIVGGPNVGIYPRETMLHDCFDYGFQGECDEVFASFLDGIAAGRPDLATPGLVHRRPGGEIAVSPEVPFPADLDRLPMPSHHLFRARYRYFGACREPYTSMIASRGCPFNCRFCGRVPGSRRVRYRSAAKLLEEMRHVRKLGFREVNFFDDLFTLNRRRVIDLCRALIDEGLDLVWSVRARVDSVDEEMLSLMKTAGCRRLYFGVESGSDRTLELMNKKIASAQAREALRLTRKLGLETVSYFIIGYPGESEADMRRTVEFASRLETDFTSFNMFEPLPATYELEKWIERGGIPDPWHEYLALKTDRIPQYHGDLDRAVVERHFRDAWRSFYLRPRTWWNLVRRVNSPARLKNFAWAGLSMAVGLLTPSRMEGKS